MWTAKTLIRLGGCPGWSESSLGVQPFCWFCHVAAQILNPWQLLGLLLRTVNFHSTLLVLRKAKKKTFCQVCYVSNQYSEGCRFDLRSGRISFIEIWSWNIFYGHSVPTADSSWAVFSYWRKYEHFVLVNCLEACPGRVLICELTGATWLTGL